MVLLDVFYAGENGRDMGARDLVMVLLWDGVSWWLNESYLAAENEIRFYAELVWLVGQSAPFRPLDFDVPLP